jgi:hypothetical protein
MALITSCSKKIPDDTRQSFSSDTVYTATTDEIDSVTAVQSTVNLTTSTEIMTETEKILVSLPEFEYQPPESLNDIIWHSNSIEKEIKYDFYKNDENITEYLPKEVVDDFSAYVKTQETDPLTWFGVMIYDMNDDNIEDYLVLARTKANYDMINNEGPFFPSARDFSAVYLNNLNSYKRILRFTVSHFTYNSYDGNDGYILTTETNQIKDIYLNFKLGYSITYDGQDNYQTGEIDFNNIFYNHEKINDNWCVINLHTMNFDGSEELFESGYYVYIKIRKPNPFGYDTLYSSDELGNPIIYKKGFPDGSDKTIDSDFEDYMNYNFYIPINDIELYNELPSYYLGEVEVKYVSVDEIE